MLLRKPKQGKIEMEAVETENGNRKWEKKKKIEDRNGRNSQY